MYYRRNRESCFCTNKGFNNYGNPILDNIDPMVWHLKDEFNEMRFDINIALSKTEYKKLCNEAGVPVNKFW